MLRSNEKQFLVFEARRLFVSLNSRPRVIKKKEEVTRMVMMRPGLTQGGIWMSDSFSEIAFSELNLSRGAGFRVQG